MQGTTARRVVVAVATTVGTLGLAASQFVAPAGAAPAAASGGEGDRVVAYENTGALTGAEIMTIEGKATSDGGCTFDMPQVELAPDETAIEARQIETNYTTCTTKVEIGTPTDAATTAPSTKSVTETAKAGSPAAPTANTVRSTDAAAGILATQSAGYYRVWWEDVIHARVHEVKSNVRWSWDGSSCVWGYSGWSNYWWLTFTQWYKDSSSQNLYPGCSLVETVSDAVYRNIGFCVGIVRSVYDNVRAQGRYDGWLLGSVDNTYTTYPFACPTLHWHSELSRTQN